MKVEKLNDFLVRQQRSSPGFEQGFLVQAQRLTGALLQRSAIVDKALVFLLDLPGNFPGRFSLIATGVALLVFLVER